MIHEYTGWHGCQARCDLKVIRHRVYTLVICTEVPDNPGTSVTNCADYLATQVCREYEIPPDRLIWIEHYGRREPSPLPESWSEVTFTFDRQRNVFGSPPQWRYITASDVEALCRHAAAG